MRLTDEEKAIAEGVAAGWVRAGASWDAAWGLAMKYIATRRKAFGEAETPGSATAAGVAAPPADASDEVVGWYVEGVGGPHRAWDSRKDADQIARERGGTVVPLVRQGSQGVRVTEEYRAAVRRAVRLLRDRNYQCVARLLDELLAVIDAANGGGA